MTELTEISHIETRTLIIQLSLITLEPCQGCLTSMMTCCTQLQGVKFSLSMPWRYTGEAEVQLPSFLISALDEGEWLTSHLGCFTPGKEPCFPLNRNWVGARASLSVWEKSLSPTWIQTLDHLACSLVTIPIRLVQHQPTVRHILITAVKSKYGLRE